MTDLVDFLIAALRLYQMILIGRILLSWLPSIDWYRQPFRLVNDLTDPVMRPFRRLIPPVGGFDFSPMLLFLLLGLLLQALESIR